METTAQTFASLGMLTKDMQILFFVLVASFLAMLWAGSALTRHVRRNATSTRPSTASSAPATRSSAALTSPRI